MAKPRHKTFRAWMLRQFTKGELRDIANHGADGGAPGLTYTADTVDLFDAYGEEIWNMAYEDAESFGAKSVPAFIADFRRVDMTDTLDGFKNLLVWYAAERIAQEVAGEE